jgi:hypothetical protein
MRRLKHILSFRAIMLAGVALLGSVSPAWAQEPSSVWVKEVFKHAKCKTKMISDGSVEARCKDFIAYVDVHPMSQQIHFYAFWEFNSSTPTWRRRAIIDALNAFTKSVTSWRETEDGRLEASGYLPYALVSEATILMAYLEFALSTVEAIANVDWDGAIA